jgi:hypothetical protein
MSENWAYCASCERSFFVPSEADGAERLCPVCCEAPAGVDVQVDVTEMTLDSPPRAGLPST